jgi:hypothetical protein
VGNGQDGGAKPLYMKRLAIFKKDLLKRAQDEILEDSIIRIE